MPSLPVGDVLRAFIKGGWLGRLLGALKGTSIKRGDWEIQLDEKPGATPPRTGLDQPAEFKPPKMWTGSWPK